MNYGSVCSGIEAATVAWLPLGWKPVFFAEIEKFPSAVLKHHYPGVPNAGDFTAIQDGDYDPIDLLVGGTPCQDFSVAGLRAGMDGARGQLTVEFAHLAGRLRPRWLVWENVPGVLSIDGGRAFGTFLGLLGQLGYGIAYRVLDAQHFGVPQRRRRVFVVGHLGDWRRAAAVLFERQSMSGYPAPSREKGQVVAGCLSPGAHPGGFNGQDAYSDQLVTHSLRADGFDASEDGTGRGTPLVVALQAGSLRENPESGPDGVGVRTDGIAYTLEARSEVQAVAFQSWASSTQSMNPSEISPSLDVGKAGSLAVAMNLRGREGGAMPELDDVASLRAASGGSSRSNLATTMAVRRLTPRECERLQGFPDDYTRISEKTADGPRYKALGNSMAVPVMSWIGERIQMVEVIA